MVAPLSPGDQPTGGVTVWWAHRSLAAALDDALLSAAERDRVTRLRAVADRERSATARGVLRLALAAVTPDDAADLVIDWDRGPVLPGSLGTWASVSHSDDAVAIAVSTAGPVGIDVESDRRAQDLAPAVQEAVFTSEERAELAAVPAMARPRAALRLWTLKEAVLKATGDGLVRAPSTLLVAGIGGTTPQLGRFEDREDLVGEVQLFDLRPSLHPFALPEEAAFPPEAPEATTVPGGYVASLAVLSTSPVRIVERDATELLA